MANKPVDTHELITPSPAIFAATDNFAIRTGDAFALVGRILLGWIFLTSGWGKLMGVAGFAGYLAKLGVPAPQFMGWVGAIAEFAIGVTLILGVATRYGALLGVIFVAAATILAHRYWTFPPEQQMAQYVSFYKNLSIIGGMMLLFVTGAGRFSADGWLRKNRR